MNKVPLILVVSTLLVGCNDKPSISTQEEIGAGETVINRAPTFSGASLSISVAEGVSETGSVTAASDPDNDVLTYSLSGPDAGRFALDNGGRLGFLSATNFEQPTDADENNVYQLTLTATDPDGLSATQDLSVAVTDVDELPEQISASVASADEQSTEVFYVAAASDPESLALTYSIAGGADADAFSMQPEGELTAVVALDFENPADSNADGSYELIIRAASDTQEITWPLAVTVADVPSALTAFEVQAANVPNRLRLEWSVSELPAGATDWVVFADSAGDGVLVELARVAATETQYLAAVPPLTTDFSNHAFRIELIDAEGNSLLAADPVDIATSVSFTDLIGFFKAGRPGGNDAFGQQLAIAGDGKTFAVGAPFEDSDGPDDNENLHNSGAVYVFTESNDGWRQTALLKASNAGSDDAFGSAVALDETGIFLLVGAPSEDGSGVGVDSAIRDDNASDSGAAYLFEFNGSDWAERAYLKATRAGSSAFGSSVALSPVGRQIVVGAPAEDTTRGAVYTFQHDNTGVTAVERILRSGAQTGDRFGKSLALDRIGEYLAIGADTAAIGGEVQVFRRAGASTVSLPGARVRRSEFFLAPLRAAFVWNRAAVLLAPNEQAGDGFGTSLALNSAGDRIAISAPFEDSAPGAVFPIAAETFDSNVGGVYVFNRDGSDWAFAELLKPSFAIDNQRWGQSLDVSASGKILAIGSVREGSLASGELVATNTNAFLSGAVTLFEESEGAWSELRTLKAANAGSGDRFGEGLAIDDSGERIVIGAPAEDSALSGVNAGEVQDDGALNTGAVYLF